MYYFINSFFEVDHSDNLKTAEALRKCGNYFESVEKAMEVLNSLKVILPKKVDSLENYLEKWFSVEEKEEDTIYSARGFEGEDKENLYITITKHKNSSVYEVEIKNYIFHFKGMFNYLYELRQIFEVCSIRIN